MLKTLLAQVKEFTKSSILTPVFAFCEVIMEMIIPLLMASIINEGVNKGDTHHIYVTGTEKYLKTVTGSHGLED